MSYKKGDYIKDKRNKIFRRILSIHDDTAFTSFSWKNGTASKINDDGLQNRQLYASGYTFDQLNAYFEPATPTEAGFPEEEAPLILKGVTGLRWRPRVGQKYRHIHDSGSYFQSEWDDTEVDEWRYRTGNCFKTEKEARAYYDSVMKD